MLVLYEDDNLCSGRKEEFKWGIQKIENMTKIGILGRLKKELRVWHKWIMDNLGTNIL
jgi:hypothetical protein